MVGDCDHPNAGVRLEDGSAAVSLQMLLVKRAGCGGPLTGVRERLQRVPGVVGARRLQDFAGRGVGHLRPCRTVRAQRHRQRSRGKRAG